MKIYLAAAYTAESRAKMRATRTVLEQYSHTVTSRWIDELRDTQQAQGLMDFRDLAEADAVVCFTGIPSTSGGFHTEVGLALAWRKQTIIVGERLNVFHHLAEIQWFPSWSAFLDDLREGSPVYPVLRPGS